LLWLRKIERRQPSAPGVLQRRCSEVVSRRWLEPRGGLRCGDFSPCRRLWTPRRISPAESLAVRASSVFYWSGQQDSNLRPGVP